MPREGMAKKRGQGTREDIRAEKAGWRALGAWVVLEAPVERVRREVLEARAARAVLEVPVERAARVVLEVPAERVRRAVLEGPVERAALPCGSPPQERLGNTSFQEPSTQPSMQ